MTETRRLILTSVLFSCGSFAQEVLPPRSPLGETARSPEPAQRATATRRTTHHAQTLAQTSTAPAGSLPVVAAETKTVKPATLLPSTPRSSRTVAYKETDVIAVATHIRFSTLILLPKAERILDFVTGDKDFWAISGSENVAYVKPAREHSQTNLNLITASGNVYSFVLTEVSGNAEVQPDLKVFVEAAEPRMVEAASGPPKFVAASEVDDYRQQVLMAKEETRETKRAAQATVDRSIEKFRGGYATNLKFVYRIEREKRPFLVSAMYHDDKFTYIQASPQETPVVYELKDGKPNLISFDYRDGTYVVSKILDSGYLSVGKEKLSFKREE